jgi:hypothetical protein
MIFNIKACHWQTESYAEHIALDSYFGVLNGTIDKIVESYLGCYGKTDLDLSTSVKVENYTSDNLRNMIDEYITYIQDFRKSLDEKNTDIQNMIDDLVGETNKLKYLLTFK